MFKHFGDNIAVDHIDLRVPAGSFFGLVGPNGAGKTTSLSMAVGLLREVIVERSDELLRVLELDSAEGTGARWCSPVTSWRWWSDYATTPHLSLADVRRFASGVLVLVYTPKDRPA